MVTRRGAGHFVLILLAMLALTGALASAGIAASYKADRPEFAAFFRIEGSRMTEMHMHPTLHCDNGMAARPGFRFEEFDLPIDPQTGRFVWRFSDGGSDTTLKGTVHKHVITGHLRTGYATSVGVNPRRCISGRPGDRWIYFAARRQPRH